MASKSRTLTLREDNDTGLSTRVQSRNQRTIRPDGSFNIDHRGLSWFRPNDIYLELISMPLWKFNLAVVAAFIAANSIFAFVYFLIGVEHLTAYEGHTNTEEFLHAFFFSAQSLTTVGYGRIAPVGILISFVATFESMMGILTFALATGLLYGRFSRPRAKLVYSEKMLIAPYRDGTALMFRIANGRKTELAEVEVQVTLSKIANENGRDVRRFFTLDLERSKIAMFPLSWTIVHPINEDSLLFDKSQEDLEREGMEILVYFKGFDEKYSQPVHYRISYHAGDLVWGAKFILNFREQSDGTTIHHLNRIGEYEPAELPNTLRMAKHIPGNSHYNT